MTSASSSMRAMKGKGVSERAKEYRCDEQELKGAGRWHRGGAAPFLLFCLDALVSLAFCGGWGGGKKNILCYSQK